ncbi:putative transcription regulator mTERF family [Helianthus annuus]|uniref:Putative transcription termination factor n=1 Tax=Helianthus annuus TaxID=4232 RepID=A0A251VMY1_HELAN|nr:transcription termination factor MTEF1, chloroplastic [Helianthus annuus]KAF5755769.1 putative transcription regulator mTERF family [Helianthus annuus]KAJ0429303.1 putative transcription regulator mTERF family [Helianthus annuus]KAJ0447671.1 putative transcription regulator mTERF family [Helianthus annuus]KAJ0632573.1 putative transcription regulator mTERF family [Helianthus annuus]KAJ0636487.1 putative transcription regulator mTERF family [Helianthus annuus]
MIVRFIHIPLQASTPQSSKHTTKTHFKPLQNHPSITSKNGVLTAIGPPPPPLLTTDSGLLFREKILYLKALKVNPTKALQKNPDFRSTSLRSLKSVENCLSSMGIRRPEFGRIFDMYPQLLTCDPYADLYPVFDFLLNDVGLHFFNIRKSILRCPRLLICSVEDQLRPTLWFLRKLGFVGPNRITAQTTMLLVSSVKGTLMPKLDYLMGLGFEYDDVVNMVLRSPGLLTFSIENNFKPKVDYFLNEMKGDLGDLKRFPQYFSYSLEGKIMRRHRLLVDHGLSVPLWEMLMVSDGEFTARLIEARLRLGDKML